MAATRTHEQRIKCRVRHNIIVAAAVISLVALALSPNRMDILNSRCMWRKCGAPVFLRVAHINIRFAFVKCMLMGFAHTHTQSGKCCVSLSLNGYCPVYLLIIPSRSLSFSLVFSHLDGIWDSANKMLRLSKPIRNNLL